MRHADFPAAAGVVDAHFGKLVPATPAAALGARVLRVATNPHLTGAPGCDVYTILREGSPYFSREDNLRLLDVQARWNSLRLFTWDALQEQKDYVMGLDLEIACGGTDSEVTSSHVRACT